ncbi:MAG: zinc-binding alcohol dehydrogenase family protein [Candidatus Sumerlaeia bacterium]
MKIWRFHEFGPIENLQMEESPVPEPGPGEALVRVAYAALNPADKYLVGGKYPRPGKPPFAVGRDGSGFIEKAGEGSRFKPGDAVVLLRSEIGVQRDGTLAQYVVVPEVSLAPLPAGWSMQEGAAGPLVLLTAWQALVGEGRLQAGNTVLITGASGGVGTASLMLAKSLGARVVALSRSDHKRARLLELGADFAFDPDDPDLVKGVQSALDGGRCDVVVENLGGPYLQKSIFLTGFKGRICVVGLLAGLKSEIEIGTFIFKRIHIIGIAMGAQTAEESQEAWGRIVSTLAQSGRRPQIDQVFPFDRVQEAFARLGQGAMGKVLVGPMNS